MWRLKKFFLMSLWSSKHFISSHLSYVSQRGSWTTAKYIGCHLYIQTKRLYCISQHTVSVPLLARQRNGGGPIEARFHMLTGLSFARIYSFRGNQSSTWSSGLFLSGASRFVGMDYILAPWRKYLPIAVWSGAFSSDLVYHSIACLLLLLAVANSLSSSTPLFIHN